MAKITGVTPSIISSGKVQVLGRKGVARVQEQFSIIRLAARRGVRCLVLECMSISPELQQLESRIFKPHYYIITNIRDDHREQMGSSLRQQAESICNAIPVNSTVVCNESEFIELIKQKASEKQSRVVVASARGSADKERLPYGVFSENLDIALKVCELAGMDARLSEEYILNSLKDDEPLSHLINTGKKEFIFLNAFSVNDVESTGSFINYWKEKLNIESTVSVILNTRADRPMRTDQLTSWISRTGSDIDRVFISGTHARRARKKLKQSGMDERRIFSLKNKDIGNLKNKLDSVLDDGSVLVGLGNIGGQGKIITEELI
jgi:poly-gamma-glutamate synthase PgsB/CapB